MSNIKNRAAFIAENETLKASGTNTNILVNIVVDRTIPIILYKDDLVTRHGIKSDTHPQISDDNVFNTITADLNGDERYIYIGYNISNITKNSVRMYYDILHKDIIVIPDTDNLILDATLQSGKVYNLSGYVLGSSEHFIDKTTFTSLYGKVSDIYSNKLPVCNKNISTTKTHIMNMPGISYNTATGSNMLGIMINDSVYLERSSSDKCILIELGTASDLLVDPSEKLPCYTIYGFTPGLNTASYCGIKTVPSGLKIGYILDF